MKRNSGFTIIETLLVVIVLAAIGFGGYKVWHNQHRSVLPRPSSKVGDTQKTTTSSIAAPDPTAGWKTYTVPENTKISFKYPSNWTVAENFLDTTPTPNERFVKIVAPETYKDLPFVLIFRYDIGASNTSQCGTADSLGVVKTDSVVINGKKLKILTETGNIDGVLTAGVSLRDDSLCTIAVPGGTISMDESNFFQSAPNTSMTLDTWESLPEATIFPTTFKSLSF